MRPTRSDAARWALAGLSVFWLGCGGGDDVPDPESDSTAAVAGAPASSPIPVPAAQAPAAVQAPDAAAVAENPAQAVPATASAPAGAPLQAASAEVSPATSAAEPVEETAAVAAAPVNGATSEMLALSKGAATPIAEGDPANPGAPVPGAPTTPQSQQQMMMAGRAAGRDQPPGNPFNPQQQMQGPAGMPGSQRSMDGFGGAGAPGSLAKPGDYRTPMGAVTAFVDAVKAKNRDSLLEATAMRASRIAAVKNQRLFGSILDGSISDEDLDDLAEIFDGYTVSMKLPAHNTGQSSVLLTKTEGQKQLTRRVEVRHEKAGWKVSDFTGYRDMQSSGSGIRRKSK